MIAGGAANGSVTLGGLVGGGLVGDGVFMPFNPNLMQEIVEASIAACSQGRYMQVEVTNTQGRLKLKAAGVSAKGADRTFNLKS